MDPGAQAQQIREIAVGVVTELGMGSPILRVLGEGIFRRRMKYFQSNVDKLCVRAHRRSRSVTSRKGDD